VPDHSVLSALPSIDALRARTRALAVLDAVIGDEPEMRYFAFDAAWDEGEEMASMDNGSGDNWFAWFGTFGAAIIGFDHESSMSPYAQDPPALWPGLFDGVPEGFRAPVIDEPAFSPDATTFIVWRERSDDAWRTTLDTDADGSADFLRPVLDDDPGWFVEFCAEYYEVSVDADLIAAVYRSEPLTRDVVRGLNPSRDVAAVLAEASAMGYPVA
jgi:hypothetical protein